ncbi:uncharacterized protein [Prorops nasuta]|uniref:uncharacterized protein n=1 Tax=Prorops nasuta TaxID=863751 RepID=UPI0034CDF084
MWRYLSVIYFLVHVVLGNVENADYPERPILDGPNNFTILQLIQNSGLNGQDRYENSLSTKETRRLARTMDEADLEEKINSKRDEGLPAVSTWIYLPVKETDDGGPTEEKKSSTFNPWGGKRFEQYRNSKIRRPIRVPFSNWGGKRGREELRDGWGYPENKKRRYLIDYAGRRYVFDGTGVKRVAETGKNRVPFNSWGGKRSTEANLQSKVPNLISNSDQSTIDAFYIDEESRDIKDDEKRAERSEIIRSRFNSWGGKRSGLISDIYNETGNDFNDREQKDNNSQWPGKRSNEILLLKNSDTRISSDTGSARKIFFPWGG